MSSPLRRLTVAILVAVSVSLNLSCTKKKETVAAKPDKDTFVFRVHSEPPNVDPAKGVDNVSIDIMNNVNEGLMQFDPEMRPVPALAESHQISADGKTYTFKLRPGVVWSDGVPLKAQHFVDGWERMLNPKTAAEYAYFLYDIDGAEAYNQSKLTEFSKVGAKAVNDLTLQVKLARPASYWLALTAFVVMFPQRLDVIAKGGERWTEPEHFVGLGPYVIKLWEHDKRMVLERNEKYWGPKPKIARAVALIVEEATTAMNLFESGQVDLVRRLPSHDIERFKSTPLYGQRPYLRGYYYAFNSSKKPFTESKVRQALGHAIDRAELPKILKGGQVPSTSWIPAGMLAHNPNIGLKYDPALAQKLLAEAGFPEGKGFPRVKMVYDVREDNKVVAEALQQMWKKILGIEFEIQTMEWKVYLETLRTDAPPVFRLGWGADFPDPHNFMDLFLTKSGNNNTRWGDKRYDELISKGSAERDAKKRSEIYDRAQKILLEEQAAIVPLFNESITYLKQTRVKDFHVDGMGNLFIKNYSLE
jgi:oligopeptide transport system substrate-binding protein